MRISISLIAVVLASSWSQLLSAETREVIPQVAVDEPSLPISSPLTAAEVEAFKKSIQACWNIGNTDTKNAAPALVGFSLDPDGALNGEPRIIKSSGNENLDKSAIRAIKRCDANGFSLPAVKLDRWQDILMKFDPSKMFR